VRRVPRLLLVLLAIIVPVGTVSAAQAPKKVPLTIVVQGPGHVLSNPAGISCPGKCKASFPAGKAVTLTATGATGGTFNHWASACKTSARCTIKPTTARKLVAVFNAPIPPPSPPPTPGPAPPAFQPGHYAGTTSDGFGIAFDVGNGEITNFVLHDGLVTCSAVGTGLPGQTHQMDREIPFADLASVAADGGFSLAYDTTFKGGEAGVSDGPFHFEIAGKLANTAASGTLTVALSTIYGPYQIECSSGIVRWTAARSGP
jgi:hypothetical protein